ncbi:dihydrofolate synthase / folylpolyglutamate synthase [Hathewaya proteolytica DSM 3090]|uniref:tetrahydrofolate synthase n=1 Tax=Hathewaya proteolytica DSM 3090 TaxID=1121331 RepID=A0A1M6N677_9CLOT|nr:folylpolyglutamate synthase/dihydrofolate synthase family protein [Hathewaya proteolytica]SHJ91235.1 dihydrofolate synthase / folylpolyglutamate synthase [Hathewaya proteolytica DSM 3090]
MDITQAMNYIEKMSSLGSVPGLEMTMELCRRLGSPQEQLKFVHIAGTNGKGSTMTYLSSILQKHGMRVGRYSSPAVFSYFEKFQINGININESTFLIILEKVKEAAESMACEGLGHPTVFEMETALAFLYFKEEHCDIVLLETGMGGTLDATNIVKNTLVAVIAKVSMDHMDFLGNTIEKIAENKAGIIKKGCHVVSAAQSVEAEKVITKKAQQEKCKISYVANKKITLYKCELNKQVFSYDSYSKLEISMNGTFQLENAALSLEICKALKDEGINISEQSIRYGLLDAKWPGRFSLISKNPTFIVDGAHNEDASVKLAQSIDKYFKGKKVIYIMGILKDKEVEKIVQNTVRYADIIITVTPPNNLRALDGHELQKIVSKYHKQVIVAESVEKAVSMSYHMAEDDGVIIAFGSLSYLGALTEIVENIRR